MDKARRIFVRPDAKVRTLRKSVSASSKASRDERPISICLPRTTFVTATAGMVKPIVASEEPSARLRLFCSMLRCAARTAVMLSGARTTKAIKTDFEENCELLRQQNDAQRHQQHNNAEGY